MPAIYEKLLVETDKDTYVALEVLSHVRSGVARCIALQATEGMSRGMRVIASGKPIQVPVGESVLGRVMDVLGEPIDSKGEIKCDKKWSIHREAPEFYEQKPYDKRTGNRNKGYRPYGAVCQGRQNRNVAHEHSGYSIFTGVGERSREGYEMIQDMTESGVLDKTALVFGQMNEPPGSRMRVALSGLTLAEYFRDELNKDVLLFIDNIYRFVQAGSEVSALLGRMPSAVGYQPTLATEMGALQERITTTKNGSITSIQAIYVPADDLTDPRPPRFSRTWTRQRFCRVK
ncbi:atp synthase [Holotrichia oblita]|nr:atp synthase [Holotrichia oblita]